jgi:8-oxo-dGTP pyrophosphatase MutT (NUDIX family)
MTQVVRHFTATTFVVWDGKVLLHRHRKQGLWLPPGGHIEPNELPDDAARREVFEETGLHVRLHTESEAHHDTLAMDLLVVPLPAFILVEDIKEHLHPPLGDQPTWLEPAHQHIDLVYYARVNSGDLSEAARANAFTWRGLDDLAGDDVPRNVVEGARLAIAYFQH